MKPGTKLKSAVCDTEVMVIRGSGVVVDCGGSPMAEERPAERRAIDSAFAGGTKIGKRYVNAAGTFELLCVKPGQGSRRSVCDARVRHISTSSISPGEIFSPPTHDHIGRGSLHGMGRGRRYCRCRQARSCRAQPRRVARPGQEPPAFFAGPERIAFFNALPYNEMGKLLRREIRNQFKI